MIIINYVVIHYGRLYLVNSLQKGLLCFFSPEYRLLLHDLVWTMKFGWKWEISLLKKIRSQHMVHNVFLFFLAWDQQYCGKGMIHCSFLPPACNIIEAVHLVRRTCYKRKTSPLLNCWELLSYLSLKPNLTYPD